MSPVEGEKCPYVSPHYSSERLLTLGLLDAKRARLPQGENMRKEQKHRLAALLSPQAI
jgi:hypothetical protein